jgi:hypothetical protein
MPEKPVFPQHWLDFKAVFWSGLFSGLMFILIGVVLSSYYFQSPGFVNRIAASLLLGPDKLLSTQAGPEVYIAGVIVQLFLSSIYTLLIAFIFHRGGLLMGLLGGALMGLALYLINFNNMSLFFPWVLPLRNSVLLATHLVFGGLSGFLYELFEDDRYDARYRHPQPDAIVEDKP